MLKRFVRQHTQRGLGNCMMLSYVRSNMILCIVPVLMTSQPAPLPYIPDLVCLPLTGFGAPACTHSAATGGQNQSFGERPALNRALCRSEDCQYLYAHGIRHIAYCTVTFCYILLLSFQNTLNMKHCHVPEALHPAGALVFEGCLP